MTHYNPTDTEFTAVTYETPGPFGGDVRIYLRVADEAEADQWIAAIGNSVPLDVVRFTGGTVEVLAHYEPSVAPAPEPEPAPEPAPEPEPVPEPAPEEPPQQ